jgi:hypothetical protein
MRRPDAKQTIGIIHLRIGYKVEPRYRAPLRRPQLSLAIAHRLKRV